MRKKKRNKNERTKNVCWKTRECFCCVNIYFNESKKTKFFLKKPPNGWGKILSKFSWIFVHLLTLFLLPFFLCIFYNSQTKNVENKTSPSETSHGVSSPSSKPSETSSTAGGGPTQKPATTTYKAFTTTYKSTSSTRHYINYTKSSDKLSEMERLRLREEFFATYDVMTGIRIAATLGGFFFLMVFLIVYKSRSHSNKALRVSYCGGGWGLEIEFLFSFKIDY